MPQNPIIPTSQTAVRPVENLDDPALDPYRCLKDRNIKARENLFIAEGLEVVRRLLQSPFDVQSVLITQQKLDRLRGDLRADTTVHVATIQQMERVAGFAIHRGVVACGLRPQPFPLEKIAGSITAGRPAVALEGIADAQNIGVIVRNAAVFGAAGVLFGSCCDPFYRRSVRVSMGNVFRVPLRECDNLERDLCDLRDRFDVRIVAAVARRDAVALAKAVRPDRCLLLFGSEGEGISDSLLRLCDEQIVIPMSPGSDSLNVSVASGIVLHHYAS